MKQLIILFFLLVSIQGFSQNSKYSPRNVYTVYINADAELLGRDEPMTLRELSSNLTEFIVNSEERENLSISPDSAVISLVRKGTSYDDYKNLCAMIQNVYVEIWWSFAVLEFGKPLDSLTKEELKVVFNAYPKLVMENNPTSFGTISFPSIPPPLPSGN